MKAILFILVIISHVKSFGQKAVKEDFFLKYFAGLDISKPHTSWIKSLEQNASVLKYEIRNPELTDTIYENYRINDHPLIYDDSTKAFLNYKLKINIDTIQRIVLDSVFIIYLYFIYGKGEVARKKMADKFISARKETDYFGREFTLSGTDNDKKDHFYLGYAYDLKDNPAFPYLFTIAWTKNKKKEYILRLSYRIHYPNEK
ncbi:MAG TPA: hypothetical protein VFT15_04920 [Chitinophagaceae bacterium]|nr:hypothetical protein [Chitinophagaceae bacterium]